MQNGVRSTLPPLQLLVRDVVTMDGYALFLLVQE